jgi:hypothetical protein
MVIANKIIKNSECRICEIMTLNQSHYNPGTSTFLSVVALSLKISHTQSMLLRIESTGRYTHHKKVKVDVTTCDCKAKIITFSYSVVVSLPLESNLFVKYLDLKQSSQIL